jgi:hypothetical protein
VVGLAHFNMFRRDNSSAADPVGVSPSAFSIVLSIPGVLS